MDPKGTTPFFSVEPKDAISFNYQPRKYLSSGLRLTNTSGKPIAFKIKTNVPICYIVKPHLGFLDSHETVDISITMQPTDYNPQNASISDKFLVNVLPLPEHVDIKGHADLAKFQQVWDAIDKSLLQSHKLKVSLRFESGSGKTGDRDSTDMGHSTSSRLTDTREQEKKGDRDESSSLMMSFANESIGANISQRESLGQGFLTRPEPELTLTQSQTVERSRVEEVVRKSGEESIKKVRVVEQPMESDKDIEETIEMLEKRMEEILKEKNTLNSRFHELNEKTEEQRKMLFELSEKNTRLKSELVNLKGSTFKGAGMEKGGVGEAGKYQLWHILLAAVASMIIGAILSN